MTHARRLALLGSTMLWAASTPGAWGQDPPAPAARPLDDPEPGTVMPAEEAARAFRVPEGFRMSVFAAEPDVRNPIAMAWDPRGRLWIAENVTYAMTSEKFRLDLHDRVVIHEDTDGDGRADKHTVFLDDVQRLTSVELGRGGVWLMCPPELLFVPDRNRDDVPDGPAEVVLDGFTVPPENYHNFANGLRWGPDGWLYGRCGASAPGMVGVPGTPEEKRIPNTGGLWRYHPERKTFEMLAHGTTNPWGHDWNALGEPFFINTVNGHLWHAIAGMHFVRVHTINASPYVYEAIDQHADHWHWDTAKDWSDSRSATGEHDRRGGGHAHSGLMIYQGDRFPADWRDAMATLNFHGRRINLDRLERQGSGYVGRHEPDRVFAADPWFRGIELSEGPDGAVYILDWSDTGECHENTGVQRSTGRVFRLAYGPEPKSRPARDLATLSDDELLALLDQPGGWQARQAQQVLADRAADRAAAGLTLVGENWPESIQTIHAPGPVERRLRKIWMLYATGFLDFEHLVTLLDDDHEAIRAWAIRLILDDLPIDTARAQLPPGSDDVREEELILGVLVDQAEHDPSALVRLILASSLQRLPLVQRPALATALVAHAEDAADHNLPLLIWYGLIPLAESNPEALAAIGSQCKLPTTRRLIARRLAERLAKDVPPLDRLLADVAASGDEALAADLLTGVSEGLRGWRKAPKPASWDSVVQKFGNDTSPESLRDRVRDLSVVFGDGRALEDVRRIALDGKADLASRKAALQALIESEAPDVRAVCEQLLDVRFLNTTAARGLARFDDPALGRRIAERYRVFHPSERASVLEVLCSRPAFASALLDQVAAGKIARDDLSAFQVRQLRALKDKAPELAARLDAIWGTVRETAADRRAAIARLKAALEPATLAHADKSQGRALFQKLCTTCHRLYGVGGSIGPDLTGSGRDNLDYLLVNMVDPGAIVTADYRMVVVAMNDGRVLNGIVRSQNERTLSLQTQTALLTLERDAIEAVEATTSSLMPDGLLDPLEPEQIRDLIGYLMHRTQVPLPAGSATAGAASGPAP